jgi:hypothetical protein
MLALSAVMFASSLLIVCLFVFNKVWPTQQYWNSWFSNLRLLFVLPHKGLDTRVVTQSR